MEALSGFIREAREGTRGVAGDAAARPVEPYKLARTTLRSNGGGPYQSCAERGPRGGGRTGGRLAGPGRARPGEPAAAAGAGPPRAPRRGAARGRRPHPRAAARLPRRGRRARVGRPRRGARRRRRPVRRRPSRRRRREAGRPSLPWRSGARKCQWSGSASAGGAARDVRLGAGGRLGVPHRVKAGPRRRKRSPRARSSGSDGVTG